MSRNGWISLIGTSLVLFVISAFIVHSSDPGIRGIIADVAFFGWLLTMIAVIALGVRALARRFRPNGTR